MVVKGSVFVTPMKKVKENRECLTTEKKPSREIRPAIAIHNHAVRKL